MKQTQKTLLLAAMALCISAPMLGQATWFSAQATAASRQVAQGQAAPILTSPFARITVCAADASGLLCTASATVYVDAAMTQPLTQPFQADAYGNFGFFAPAGRYVAQVTSSLGIPGKTLYLSSGGSSGGSGAVSTVNNVQPVAGNVQLGASDVGALPANTPIVDSTARTAAAAAQSTATSAATAAAASCQPGGINCPPFGQGTVKTVNAYQPDANGNVTVPNVSGNASVGTVYTPQLSTGNGSFLADVQTQIDTANRFRSIHILNYQDYNNEDGFGALYTKGITSDSFKSGLYNLGSWSIPTQNASGFTTTSHAALFLRPVSHTSSIDQGVSIKTGFYNNADNAVFYIYNNFEPGGAKGGSDENHTGMRFGDYPASTFNSTLTSDSRNVTGSNILIPATGGNGCGGSGGSTDACMAPGSWLADFSDPVVQNLHSTGYTPTSQTTPGIVTIAEGGLNPDAMITSTTPLGIGDFTNGDTVTIPFTAPSGFVDPQTNLACVSGPLGTDPETMGYTISGSNIRLTGHRYVHSFQSGGNLTIFLNQGCRVGAWRQDTADNSAGGTTGGGPTFYIVLGNVSANQIAVAQYEGGARFNGSLIQSIFSTSSITMDGGTRSAFDIWPAAFLVDVFDPTTAPGPGGPAVYSHLVRYLHVGTNNVPWASGKSIGGGYNPASTSYMFRYIADNPLPSTSKGSAFSHTEIRGSLANINEWYLVNSPSTGTVRGLPNGNLYVPYNGDNSAGALGVADLGYLTPTYCWICSTRVGPGGNLNNTVTHYLWSEGAAYTAKGGINPQTFAYIRVNGGNGDWHTQTMSMGLPTNFDNGVSASSISTNTPAVGTTCTVAGYFTIVVDGVTRKVPYCQ